MRAVRNGEHRCQRVSLHSPQLQIYQNPLTTFVEPAARVLPLLDSVLLLVTLETVFTRRRGRVILYSCRVTTVIVPPACLEVEDVVNSEFQRGGGSTWCVHFVHILQDVSPLVFTSATLLAVNSKPGR